jgi:3-dehydroquinate synthase
MTRVHTIHFDDKNKDDYDIIIGSDILPEAFKYIVERIPKGKRAAIITDRNVAEKGHLAKLGSNGLIPAFVIEPDSNKGVESKKNLKTYGEIIDFLDSNGFERDDCLLCLGGGVIGDIGGLAAATYKRTGISGMSYVQIPTTTLSQADSCVGGKCAVNSAVSKNAVRCFYQPHLVISDVSTLLTLDDRNFSSGLVESVKYGLILDPEYFSFLEKYMDDILRRDTDILEEIALRNVELKGSVVKKDPDEKNYRRCLNFGHTVGHAIEIASDFKLYHGESVALGILAALDISEVMGRMKWDRCKDAEKLLSRLGMPKKVPSYADRAVVEQKLANDKKAVDGVPYFVTLDDIGKVHAENEQYASPVPKEALTYALDNIFE